MKRYNSTLIKMTRRLGMAIAALLILSTMASCSDQDSQAPATGDEAYLNLSFSTASATTSRASRAGDNGKDDETQANPTTESDIHSIKVWVFQSGTGPRANPIAYKEDTPPAVDGKPVNGNYTLNLRFLRKINGVEIKNIDLYILANSESTNMAKKLENEDFRSITRADLQGVTFDTPFGITEIGITEKGKAETTEVPTEGLPISRAITNIAIAKHVADTEIEAKSKRINIPLVRAVSKLHFYFARKAGDEAMTGNVKVTRIEIDKKTFPTASYVFPDEEDYATADANKAATRNKYGTPTYVDKLLTLDGVENTGIKEVKDPLTYKRGANETAQAYMDRMNKDIGGHDLSYLRETNKPITGKIYYQLAEDGFERFQSFTIPSSNAIRNRELVVYGYFLQGGALCLDWQVMPWNKVTSDIGWNGANCQMFAWQTPSTNETEFTPNPQGGDAEGLYCLVNYPRYQDKDHNYLEDATSGAAFYFKVESPAGLVWKAHLTNTDDFAFNYDKSTESTTCVSTGIARTAPYQIKVEAKNAWTNGTSWKAELTDWAKRKGDNPVFTDLYVTVSLDGIHEYEVEINPDGVGGRYKNGRKFAGTNTRIRIFQLRATEGTAYYLLQKNSGHYTNYLNN